MEFQILGPLEARRDGTSLTLRGSKQRLLLATLLLRANELVSSDSLIEALWGETPPPTAAKALQVQVSQLRGLLEPGRKRGDADELLATRAPGYELRLEHGQLDLHRFERAVAEARAGAAAGRRHEAAAGLASALELWRGPALADLAYEASLQTDLARLEELRLAALEDRIDADLAIGRHAELTGELEGLAAAHPMRERIRAQLMLALYRSGRQAEALEAYREGRSTLVDELGLEPGRAVQELERSILNQDPALDLPAPLSAPELVGRERELVALAHALDAAFAGRGSVALIGGEPGIGKSRLAEALAARAEQRGARVLAGRCWEAGGAPPYWPWTQALRAHAGAAPPELRAMLPELAEGAPPPAEPESEATRFRAFRAVAALIRDLAAGGPLVFVLDDLHAADTPSLLLLRFVARDIAGVPVFVVGCYRDTEVGPELADALAEVGRDAANVRVSLEGLGSAATADLLERAMGRTPPGELAARVHAETGGNPLFAGEVGRLLASAGSADAAAGELPIPDGVREAIDRRLQGQSERCVQVLTLASVLGREFDLDALERVAGLSQEELFAELEEAVAARLVAPVRGVPGRFRFSHVLVRDVVYDGVPATRRLRMHGELGEALEDLYSANPGPHLAELAHHFLEAGGAAAPRAIDYATRAGDRAASQLAYEEAARHYARALDLIERVGGHDEGEVCELVLRRGEAESRAGRGEKARDAFRRAADLAERGGRTDQLARAAMGYGGRFAWARAGSDPVLVPLLERALAAVGDEDSPERAGLLARLASAIRDEPLRQRRLGLAEQAVAVGRALGVPRVLADALNAYWPAVEGPDNLDVRPIASELLALAAELGDAELAYVAHEYRLNWFWKSCDRPGVDVEREELTRRTALLRQPAQEWQLHTIESMVALMEGRFDVVEEGLAEALDLGFGAQGWNATVSHRIALFVLRREQGRLAEVEPLIGRSVHEFPALLRFECAMAHLHAELGHEREARAALQGLLARDLANEHLDAEWMFAMSLLPDVCGFLGDAEAAMRLHGVLLPHAERYAQAPLEASFGSIARSLGVLAATMARYDEAQAHLEAAIDVERRMGARPWLAHARHDLASMLLGRDEADDRERAEELLADTVAAYRELGMGTWADRASGLRSARSPG